MKYELIQDSNKGVLIDRTPLLRDVRDTFEVSFLPPDNSALLALFKDAGGVEYRKAIKDGICKVPKELLAKEQYVELTVCQIDNDKILQSWECEPLKVTAFFGMRRNQWQLSGGMTDKDCLARLIELEKAHTQTLASVKTLNDKVNTQAEQIVALASLKVDNGKLTTAYNSAIEVINDLSRRVAAVEKHYDPTLIK